MHGPDAKAHRDGAANQPQDGWATGCAGYTAGHIQGRIGRKDGNDNRAGDQNLVVTAFQHQIFPYVIAVKSELQPPDVERCLLVADLNIHFISES